MKKIVLTACICLFSVLAVFAQKKRYAKEVIQLQMPGDEGSNGASVAWHPEQQKYYAAFAGNWQFPMAVFNASGAIVSPEKLNTQVDMRGLWYNDETKTLQANQYGFAGVIEYKLNSKGVPEGDFTSICSTEDGQPEEQSVGSYDPTTQSIAYYKDYKIYLFDKCKQKKEIKVSSTTEYNTTSMVCTGSKKTPYALLNYEAIHLFDSNGKLKTILTLPEGVPAEESFNFAFANGKFFLFDVANRKWIGYTISKKK